MSAFVLQCREAIASADASDGVLEVAYRAVELRRYASLDEVARGYGGRVGHAVRLLVEAAVL